MSFAQRGPRRPSSSHGFSRGGGRPQFSRNGNRPQGQRRFFGKSTRIDPSRYVNQAVAPIEETPYEPKHQFGDFGLHPQIMANITERGYTEPTPIQDMAIEPIMAGKDVVGIADTGTGKTAAFLLPLIHKIANNPDQGVLIVVPTRELASQIADEFHIFARGMRISQVLCVGGLNIIPQMQKLDNDPHFVIGTPGRLKDLVNRGALRPEMYTHIVLDEVDRMLDIGFLKDIQFLISVLPSPRQSFFFSATINGDAKLIMEKLLIDPVKIQIKTGETSDHVEQDVVRLQPGQNKAEVLYSMLTQREIFSRVIVFNRTKHGTVRLEQTLQDWGIRVASIHGNKTQSARQYSLNQFKEGRVQALLATDVAARGIDIDDVSHVINFDEPESYEDYVHRIGRTGRAGKRGKALTFVV